MATGIIQANSEAQNNAVKNFIRGRTGGHRGTHQVIGDKIRFGLGSYFDAEAVASAIEREGASDGEATTTAAIGATTVGATGYTSSQSEWIWSEQYGRYYRTKSDGTTEWWQAPASSSDGEWTYSQEHRRTIASRLMERMSGTRTRVGAIRRLFG